MLRGCRPDEERSDGRGDVDVDQGRESTWGIAKQPQALVIGGRIGWEGATGRMREEFCK